MVTKFKKRKKAGFSESIFFSILIALLISAGVGFLIFENIKISQKRTKFNSQVEILKIKLQELKTRNDLLKAGISKAGDEEYIEEVAREELNYQKRGETTVAFPLSETKNKEDEEEKEKKSFLKNLWQKILGE